MSDNQTEELLLNEPTGGYGNQRQYFAKVLPAADLRLSEVEENLRKAFSRFIETRKVEVVVFESMSATDLAEAISEYPLVLKPLLAACNLAGRALKRDLKIDNIDTYAPLLSEKQAGAVAGYLLSFLPKYLEIPTLSRIDRVSFIDKEIRKNKGSWEKQICDALNQFSASSFKKRKFETGNQRFELDAATPAKGEVRIGIDIKRIEARQDIHKRCDEIVNKAAKLNATFPNARFGAVIYYPFVQDHSNVQSRLDSPYIHSVVFASNASDSIDSAVRLLLAKVERRKGK